MKTPSLKRLDFTPEERNFWKNIEVNIDSYSDRWDDTYQSEFAKELAKLPNSLVRKILLHFEPTLSVSDDQLKETLSNNRRISIITLGITAFVSKHPLMLTEMFNIKKIKKTIDKPRVIEAIFDTYVDGRLTDLFLYLLKQKFGKGRQQFSFVNPINDDDYTTIEDFMPNLATFLKRKDKASKSHHFRFGYKGRKGEWIFLLLKETGDRVHIAIPNNISVVSGAYKLITIHPNEKWVEVHGCNKAEAYIIRNYVMNKLDNVYTYVRNEHRYNPTKFFAKVLNKDPKQKLKLLDANFKQSNLGVRIKITDMEKKNDIVTTLTQLKKLKLLKLEDFSEFDYLLFSFEGLTLKVQVFESTWGLHKLNLVDKNISPNTISKFKSQFKSQLGVPLDIWLKKSDDAANNAYILSKILNQTTVKVETVTDEVESVLLDLMSHKLIDKIQPEARRVCFKSKQHKTWEKGDGSCPFCGNPMRIDGDFIDVSPNAKGIYSFVFTALKKQSNIIVSRNTIQISKKKHQFIEIINKAGENLSIYISSGTVPEEIVDHFKDNGLPLLVILTKYKDALANTILENNFECVGFVDFYLNHKTTSWIESNVISGIKNQKLKWHQKLLDKGFSSYKRIGNQEKKYSPQDFETDIFNMFHEIFYAAFKLGGSYTGVAAPDGIFSVQDRSNSNKKFCLSYDTKFSKLKKGYQLNEPPKKHRHYINSLRNNSRVKLFGGLKVHAIISQNMDMSRYESFYNDLTNRFKWSGQVLFIHDSVIIKLYDFYRSNTAKINSKPHLFYSCVHRMFLKIHKKDSEPFPTITMDRLLLFCNEVTNKYKKHSIVLKFNRADFK